MIMDNFQNQLYSKNNIILNKSFDFSLKIIKIYQQLTTHNEYIISKQLLKSATSIWANIMESKYGASKKDFLNKIYISLKEANETLYWIELLKQSWIANYIEYDEIIKDINEILAILNKITITTKKNLKN